MTFGPLAGFGVGAASGFVVPPISTAIGGLIGAGLGATVSALMIAVVGVINRRAGHISQRAARAWFMVPAVIAILGSATIAGSLLTTMVGGIDFDKVMVLVFALPLPLALPMVYFAAPWCLEPIVPAVRRPRSGRRLLYSALPTVVTIFAAPAVLIATT